jgi:hypothetical protein
MNGVLMFPALSCSFCQPLMVFMETIYCEICKYKNKKSAFSWHSVRPAEWLYMGTVQIYRCI